VDLNEIVAITTYYIIIVFVMGYVLCAVFLWRYFRFFVKLKLLTALLCHSFVTCHDVSTHIYSNNSAKITADGRVNGEAGWGARQLERLHWVMQHHQRHCHSLSSLSSSASSAAASSRQSHRPTDEWQSTVPKSTRWLRTHYGWLTRLRRGLWLLMAYGGWWRLATAYWYTQDNEPQQF